MAAAAVTAAAMVATPLARPGGAVRRMLSSVVVSGLFTATAVRAAQRWGPERAVTAATAVAALTAGVERVGTRTGLPFGRYHYTGALRPQVGGVPVIVPLAWFAMAVPAREVAVAVGAGRPPAGAWARWRRLVLGSGALTAWDLFLDPQMVGEGYWRWARHGRYRSIPLSNFAGWFLTGLVVMAVLEVALPPGGRMDAPADVARHRPRAADPALVGVYGYMAAMETVGFAAFFRDRLVALVGGVAMVPLAAAGLVASLRSTGPAR